MPESGFHIADTNSDDHPWIVLSLICNHLLFLFFFLTAKPLYPLLYLNRGVDRFKPRVSLWCWNLYLLLLIQMYDINYMSREMPWPKTGATNYNVQLGLQMSCNQRVGQKLMGSRVFGPHKRSAFVICPLRYDSCEATLLVKYTPLIHD